VKIYIKPERMKLVMHGNDRFVMGKSSITVFKVEDGEEVSIVGGELMRVVAGIIDEDGCLILDVPEDAYVG
jgi:hypothetical protein